MLNLNCVICAELFAHSDDVYTTKCGHMFHFACLTQWLDRSQSCPQCRNRCTERNIFRVYFNLANIDASRIDVGSLQEQLDNANLQLKMKEQELHKAGDTNKILKDMQKKCMKTINGLEEQLKKNGSLIKSYTERFYMMAMEVKVIDQLREEVKSLKNEIETMDDIKTILKGTSDEAKKILETEKDSVKLSKMIATLRRELRQSEAKKTNMRNIVKVVQSNLRKETERKESHQAYILQLESENYQLSEKIKALETAAAAKPCSSNSLKSISLELNSSNSLAPYAREQKRQTISPMTQKAIKNIEESNSPYLNIKSSSIGMVKLFKRSNDDAQRKPEITTNTANKRATPKIFETKTFAGSTMDGGEKYSIFKKPRLGMVTASLSAPTMKPLAPNIVFNGFGGTEKMDPFAHNSDEDLDEEDARRERRLAELGSGKIASAVASSSALNLNNRMKSGGLRNFKIKK